MKKILLLKVLFLYFLQSGYAQPGKLDSSFGTNGIVVADFGKPYNYGGTAKKILSQNDGSSYNVLDVSGKTLITKTLSTGVADVNYGQKGFSAFADISPVSAALQQDGKIVVAGNTIGSFGVTRFNTDGSIDTGFSTAGIKGLNDPAFYFTTRAVAVQGDGKIVVAGGLGDDAYDNRIIVIRLNADGSPDTTFDGYGQLQYDFNGTPATSIAIQHDNKIVVSVYDYDNFVFLRFNVDGILDTSFSNDGIQTTAFTDKNGNSLRASISSTIVQTDGKIVAAGFNPYEEAPVCLARYNTDGSLDASFSDDGKQISNFAAASGSAAIQSDGKIIVSGSASISRYNTNGSLDSTFNTNGTLTTDFQIASIALQNGKKVLLAGNPLNKANHDFTLARYNNNGSIDNTFSDDGKFVSNFKAGNTNYTSSAIQKDKKVVAVGKTWNGSNFDFLISRYNYDGSIDNTFHGNGKQTADFSSKNDYADAVAIQNDGKIIVGGYSVKNGKSSFSLARYNTDGSPDNTFDSDGLLNLTINDYENITKSVLIQTDGKILLAGSSALIRFNTDGSLDHTFNLNGILTVGINQAALQADGKIVVAPDYSDFSVARINTNGSFDSSFGKNGVQSKEFYDYDGNQNYSVAYTVAIQNDGKIVAGGHCDCHDRFETYSKSVASRFNTDGSFDNTFEGYGYVNLLSIQNDGKIIFADTVNKRVQRFYKDLFIDPNFKGLRGDYSLTSLKTVNKNLYATGYAPVGLGVIARYFYDDGDNSYPVVSITAPADSVKILTGQHIKIRALASDSGGAISKVEFYVNGILSHTETVFPYGYSWTAYYSSIYTLTVKAYDNTGLVTISAPVHVLIFQNNAPVISIIKPVNNQTYAAPAYVHLEAAASDIDGKIMKVEFYNGSDLLRTEYKYPYTYVWKNVPRGSYTITAVAADNLDSYSYSAPVTVRVVAPAMVSSKPYSKTEKTTVNDALSLRLSPNPATTIVNIYTNELQPNKPATISIISVPGIVLKTMQIRKTATQLDVSSLTSGVYTLKIISGEKILYKQFVKL